MSKFVMGIAHDGEALLGVQEDKLVSFLCMASPELVVMGKEVVGLLVKAVQLF